jgi:hypothetical protein
MILPDIPTPSARPGKAGTMVYSQSDGEIIVNGNFEGYGYSGCGGGRNNPDAQQLANSGPIPQGEWIIGPMRDGGHLGPFVFDLTPCQGTQTFGRSLFRIHGDNITHNASEGCIIAGRAVRLLLWHEGIEKLEVVR